MNAADSIQYMFTIYPPDQIPYFVYAVLGVGASLVVLYAAFRHIKRAGRKL